MRTHYYFADIGKMNINCACDEEYSHDAGLEGRGVGSNHLGCLARWHGLCRAV